MMVAFGDLEFHLFKSDGSDDVEAPNVPGWYWHECHHAIYGPFISLRETLADVSEWLNERYDRAPDDAVGHGDD